jgi:hypothetical protein
VEERLPVPVVAGAADPREWHVAARFASRNGGLIEATGIG